MYIQKLIPKFTEEIKRLFRDERTALCILNAYYIIGQKINVLGKKRMMSIVNNHPQQSLETYTLTLIR